MSSATSRTTAHVERRQSTPASNGSGVVLTTERAKRPQPMAGSSSDDDFAQIACAGAHPAGGTCRCHLVEHGTIVFSQYHGGKVGNRAKSDSPLPLAGKVAHCLRGASGAQTPRPSAKKPHCTAVQPGWRSLAESTHLPRCVLPTTPTGNSWWWMTPRSSSQLWRRLVKHLSVSERRCCGGTKAVVCVKH